MKKTITIPVEIELYNSANLEYQVRIAGRPVSSSIAFVKLTNTDEGFGAVVSAGEQSMEFAPEGISDITDAVIYYAAKFYAARIFDLQQ